MNPQPVKRSSVNFVQAHHHHARFQQQHGWEIVLSYGDPAAEKQALQSTAALVDVSWLGKLECKGDWVSTLEGVTIPGAAYYRLILTHAMWIVQPASLAEARAALEHALVSSKQVSGFEKHPSPSPSSLIPQDSTSGEKAVPRTGVGKFPLPSEGEDKDEGVSTIGTRQKRSYLLDTSSLYASFELLGPHAADVLCKLGAVQVPAGGHKQAPVAGVHCLVVHREHGFQFHFGREFGEYMWECFLDAGDEFGLRPAGVEAMET